MLAKTLRLDVAELTDIGRRRERNQDSITSLIPSDTRTLEEKGALFVVCDGMGGHAAGEVASAMGVNTIRDEYYKSEHKDVITAIASAVERANIAIYQHASEHPELSGMGTTCVALVVAGGRAFVVNIGDSRAYIIRNGKMRQVTRDHSWVAEQVRVGLLTEEQARTHSHRNVITRSLGTQPNVTADLFVETMHDGDRVLLCSDGLHGYVDEGEIERVVTSDAQPEAAVHSLIDMANNNGGPDNISATLVHLLDVPPATGALMLPDSAIPAEGITQPLPVVGAKAKGDTKSARRPSQSQPAAYATKRRSSRRGTALVNTLRALVAILIVAIAVGFWYFAFGPYGQQQAANQQLRSDVTAAQQVISHAPSQDPAAALIALGQARDKLVSDLANPHLDAQYHSVGQDVLSHQLQPAVQQAIQRYNNAALVTPVNTSAAKLYSLSCQTGSTKSTLGGVTQLVAASTKAKATTQQLYALSGGQLFEVKITLDGSGMPATNSSCTQIPLKGISSVIALAMDGTTLNVLEKEANGTYLVQSVTLSGTTATATTRFYVRLASGDSPELLTASGSDVYVAFARGAGTFGVWHYVAPLPVTIPGKTTKPPTLPTGPAQTIMVQRQAVSMAYAHGVLYMLDSAGGLSQIDSAKKFAFSALPVQIPGPLQPIMSGDYSVATPVPTPAPTATNNTPSPTGGALSGANVHAAVAAAATATATTGPTATPIPAISSTPSGTLFGQNSSLAIDPAFPTHLLVGDAAGNRLVRLVASASGPGLGFAAQYAYGSPLAGSSQLALASTGTQLVVYTWANNQLAAYTVAESGAGA